MSHFLLMVLYSLLLGIFFALLWRRRRAAQIKLFFQVFLGMVLGALALAWLMYPFPSGPPAPFP